MESFEWQLPSEVKSSLGMKASFKALSMGIILVVFVTSLVSTTLPSSAGQAVSSDSSPDSAVETGVLLVNVQKFDIPSGSYDLDFYMWFKWSGNKTINYEFMNGKASSTDIVKSVPGYLEVRVRGTFLKSLDFRDFPFNSHELTVELEDKVEPIDSLRFTPDVNESGIDQSINIAGWNVQAWSVNSVKHAYPGDETYSRLVFSFTIGKSTLPSVLKSIVPIAIITCIALLAFLVSPTNYGQRISLGVTTLMAAVAFHLALTSQIPPVGYLTIADKVMITAYGLFLYSLIISVLVMKLTDQKKPEEALRLNKRAGLVVPVIAIVLISVLMIFA